jgi:poly(3-hydroxybutyrate) depolymerase
MGRTAHPAGVGRIARLFLAALLFMAYPDERAAAQPAAPLARGSGSFVLPFPSTGATREIKVWYHRPDQAGLDAPVVFVMHGAGRNGEGYRKAWIPIAEERRFILLVPEFSRAQFAGDYNLERMTLPDGTGVPREQWPYTAIEDIFDAVGSANKLSARTYDIYGHSAGAQFVHRLVLLLPDARYHIAVAANAGWYTMPDFGVAYPYGFARTDVTPAQLAKSLGRRLVVLLGDQDTDPNHPQLRRAPEAMAQGDHRYARGHTFFERAQRAAAELNAPFAWALRVAPGVAHRNSRMTPHAAAFVGGRD